MHVSCLFFVNLIIFDTFELYSTNTKSFVDKYNTVGRVDNTHTYVQIPSECIFHFNTSTVNKILI
jgi:hypothetical protein